MSVLEDDLDAEQAVLGALLTTESVIEPVIATGLTAAHFSKREHHGFVFEAILELHREGKPVDAITVPALLKKRGQLDAAGGRNAIGNLAATTPAPGNAAHYAGMVIDARNGSNAGSADGRPAEEIEIVTAEEFAAVDEAGAEPLVGSVDEVLIPEGGDVMIYGDGGASKTTLGIDIGCHLAAGDDWLGAPVPKPVRVGLIEAEGPRALFRRKLRRKLEQWTGSEIGDRLQVLESPWAAFRFPSTEEMAAAVAERELDMLIVGPLSRVGMDEHGTLQEVRDFMGRVNEFRARARRRLTVGLIHHENKGGAVSGAWEGAGDTLFHGEVHARGRTTLTVQKARWSSEWHKRSLELAWTDGEGFEVIEEEERDLVAEITIHLRDNPHRTAKEIAAPPNAGVGANVDTVKGILEHNQDRFISRTKEAAKAVGRHPSATVWEVTQAPSHLESPDSLGGGDGQGDLGDSPLRGVTQSRVTTPSSPELTQLPIHPESPEGSEAA